MELHFMMSGYKVSVILIYLLFNFFKAGYDFSDDMDWARSRTEYILAWSRVLLNITFGLLVSSLYFSYYLLAFIFDVLENYIQLRFFIRFIFSKKFTTDWPQETFLKLYTASKTKRKSNTPRNIIYRFGVNLILKRNDSEFVEIINNDGSIEYTPANKFKD